MASDPVRALRFLDESKGVRFHTSLPEDRCVRLLVKRLGRQMPEDVVQQELETLAISVQGVLQLRSGLRDQDVFKTRP
jgi:ethanolamine ammonia-lyase small subunit